MYSFLKDKQKNIRRELSFNDILLNMISSMFESDLPLRYEYIEMVALMMGNCGFFLRDDKIVFGWCAFKGNIGRYGFGKDCALNTLDNEIIEFNDWEDNEDLAIIFNNYTGMPDFNIERFASMFAEVDKSLKNNVINARSHPIYKAKDEKEKAQVEAINNSNKDGETAVIVDKGFMDDLGLDGGANKVINLTDVSISDKLQYLSNFSNDLRRRLYNYYGVATQGSDKMAQMTKEEVNNGSAGAQIVPSLRLKLRKRAIDKFNNRYGTNYYIRFSDVWAKENIEKLGNDLENKEGGEEDENN